MEQREMQEFLRRLDRRMEEASRIPAWATAMAAVLGTAFGVGLGIWL